MLTKIPYNLVPISIQPLPIFLATLLFGWPAVSAYVLYLMQGAFGAPIFAWSMGGFATLVKLEIANIITFIVGLAQLAVFVPTDKILSLGLYPFFIGDFIVKASALAALVHWTRKR